VDAELAFDLHVLVEKDPILVSLANFVLKAELALLNQPYDLIP
jgi:hypothetical protein